jgi:hypothetical protein
MQEYTDGFRKMALMLNIPLHRQKTLMKYIGGLPAHLETLYSCLDPLTLMRFMFKRHILKQGKQMYQGNRLQGKRTRGNNMTRIQMQWQGRKGSPLARIAM